MPVLTLLRFSGSRRRLSGWSVGTFRRVVVALVTLGVVGAAGASLAVVPAAQVAAASLVGGGGKIAFTEANINTGNLDYLRVLDSDGGNLSTIADDVVRGADLAWSPDGTRIAYSAGLVHTGSPHAVTVMNLTDGTTSNLGYAGTYGGISWSPDGNYIAYYDTWGGIGVAKPDGTWWTHLGQSTAERGDDIHWSPESGGYEVVIERIDDWVYSDDPCSPAFGCTFYRACRSTVRALEVDTSAASGAMNSGWNRVLHTYETHHVRSTSTCRMLDHDFYFAPRWSPSGERVYFTKQDGQPVEVSSVDGSGMKALATDYADPDSVLSPDGAKRVTVAGSGSNLLQVVNVDGSGPQWIYSAGAPISELAWSTPPLSAATNLKRTAASSWSYGGGSVLIPWEITPGTTQVQAVGMANGTIAYIWLARGFLYYRLEYADATMTPIYTIEPRTLDGKLYPNVLAFTAVAEQSGGLQLMGVIPGGKLRHMAFSGVAGGWWTAFGVPTNTANVTGVTAVASASNAYPNTNHVEFVAVVGGVQYHHVRWANGSWSGFNCCLLADGVTTVAGAGMSGGSEWLSVEGSVPWWQRRSSATGLWTTLQGIATSDVTAVSAAPRDVANGVMSFVVVKADQTARYYERSSTGWAHWSLPGGVQAVRAASITGFATAVSVHPWYKTNPVLVMWAT